MFTFAGMVLILVAAKNDAAITPIDETYTRSRGSDVLIPWTYDNVADMDSIDWSFKSSLSPTPTLIMDKVGAAAVTVYNSFNVEHVSDGSIILKAVTLNNVGIYYCTIVYSLVSGHATETGTVTLFLTTDEKPDSDRCSPELTGAIGGGVALATTTAAAAAAAAAAGTLFYIKSKGKEDSQDKKSQ